MKRITSPNDIEILIHYYAGVGDHERLDAPAVKESIERFIKAGLIIKSKNDAQSYEGNRDALEVYINALCSVQLPVNTWIIPNPIKSKPQ